MRSVSAIMTGYAGLHDARPDTWDRTTASTTISACWSGDLVPNEGG